VAPDLGRQRGIEVLARGEVAMIDSDGGDAARGGQCQTAASGRLLTTAAQVPGRPASRSDCMLLPRPEIRMT
jgi:hypothetical protein